MNRSVIAVGVVLTLVASACSGDDDATVTSAVETVASTAPPTTESTTTTTTTTTTPTSTATSTTTSTTVAPSTSLTDDELKARIAADYEQAAELPRSRTVTETATADPSQGVTAETPDAPRRNP